MALEGDKIAKPQFDLKLFWRLFTFGTPYINLIILGVFLIVLSSVAYIFNPYIIGHTISIARKTDNVRETVLGGGIDIFTNFGQAFSVVFLMAQSILEVVGV